MDLVLLTWCGTAAHNEHPVSGVPDHRGHAHRVVVSEGERMQVDGGALQSSTQ